LVRGRGPPRGPAERLSEGRRDQVDPAENPAVLRRPSAGLPHEAARVRVVHHDEGVVLPGEIADLRELRYIAVHRKDTVGRDHAVAGARGGPQLLLEAV